MDAPVDSRRRHAAAVRIQAAVRRLIARGPLIDLVNAVYEKAYDESSGHFFYFNRKTGESTWERPKFLRGEEDVELTPRSRARFAATADPAPEWPDDAAPGSSDGDRAAASAGEDNASETAGGAGDDAGGSASGAASGHLGATAGGRALAAFRLSFDMGAFLEEHGLERFQEALEEEGFEDAEALLEATSDDLEAVGLRTGHRRVMARAVDALRERMHAAGVPIAADGGVDVAALGGSEPEDPPPAQVAGGAAAADLPMAGAGGTPRSGRRSALRSASPGSPSAGGHADSWGFASPQAGQTTYTVAAAPGGAVKLGGLVDVAAREGRAAMAAQRVAEREGRLSGSRGGVSRSGSERGDSRDGRRFTEAEHAMSSEIVLEVLLPGHDPEAPREGQIVRLHYEGRLPSGHVFESSRDRGRAFQFRLGAGQVIRGMEFAVAQLTRGCRARFRVPPELAYGAAGRLPKVPPNTPLEFEVQIIDFFSPDVDLTPRDEFEDDG
ncbi:hypothetical protein FNF29_08109 [Cafeteria roenbergensis]|uniref:peptidylprolyl isomerase n=1 Tax=Cafeteria roenbergensis TaxID=33653 RepID=A0A5A8C023_CAFRO|nr:hypothetical protein FNF29_08109 [Cafeteria roenbergensis]|eukprot:KAA0146336.1 hypothetical protein FNF29_08109 [Cafeteria roenbergensis]